MKGKGRAIRKNWFLVGIFVVLVAAIVAARLGLVVSSGFSRVANRTLVVFLFLLSGVNLPSETILGGLRDVRLHLYVQLFIFAVVPLYFLATGFLFRSSMDGLVTIGFFALACLPTTISSCIIFTQSAGGNVVGTMFNAALANVAGIFLSPFILSLLLRGAGRPLPLAEALRIVRNLGLLMLAPVVVGQLIRAAARERVTRHKALMSTASSIAILMIVFLALLRAATDPGFTGLLGQMVWPFAFLGFSNILLVALAYAGARLLRFSPENTISVLFAAPQKTLAMGIPLLTTFFAGQPEVLAVAMLPLLFYHPWQLLVAGVVRGVVVSRRPVAG